MIVKGGYLKGTNSLRMHPIKNVIVKNSKSWSRITVKALNDAVTLCNIGFNYHIKLTIADNYDVVLYVNEKEYFKSRSLFEFQVEIDTDDETVVEFKDDHIYDG